MVRSFVKSTACVRQHAKHTENKQVQHQKIPIKIPPTTAKTYETTNTCITKNDLKMDHLPSNSRHSAPHWVVVVQVVEVCREPVA